MFLLIIGASAQIEIRAEIARELRTNHHFIRLFGHTESRHFLQGIQCGVGFSYFRQSDIIFPELENIVDSAENKQSVIGIILADHKPVLWVGQWRSHAVPSRFIQLCHGKAVFMTEDTVFEDIHVIQQSSIASSVGSGRQNSQRTVLVNKQLIGNFWILTDIRPC